MLPLLDPDEMPPWLAGLFALRQGRRGIVAGINDDDCAVLRWKSRYFIVTLDFLNANPIALELGIGGMLDLGRLIVAANLSDLCGSGACPVALLVGLTLPKGAPRSDFKQIMRGVKIEADLYGVPVVGGDSKLGNSRAVVAVAIGAAKSRRHLFLKNAARAGDIVWVSGELGSAAAASWGYRRSNFGTRWKNWARRALLVPRLPLMKSRKVSASRFGHGGTDISDGLGADLKALCDASRVGVILDAEKIPVEAGVKEAADVAGVQAWKFAFASGGDFQFIVTTPEAARSRMERFGLFEVGHITRGRDLLLRSSGGRLLHLPIKGHRDRRNLRFAEEIDVLIQGRMRRKLIRV